MRWMSLVALCVLGLAPLARADDAGALNEALRAEAFAPQRLRARRRALGERLPRRSLALLLAPKPPANDYEAFDQHPDLLYLTGLERSGIALLIWKDGEGAVRDALVLPRRDRMRELWEGAKLHFEAADAEELGYDEVVPAERFLEVARAALKEGWTLVEGGRADAELRGRLGWEGPMRDLGVEVAALRVKKDEAEVALLQRAIDVTAAAQLEAMASIAPGQREFEVEAVVEYVFRRLGAERPAFQSIVGSGPKGCVLHYQENRRQMQEGELVVVDIGARVGGYCADVTRTFPVSGRFSARQRELYELVLMAQQAGIAAVKPGATLRSVHAAAAAVLREAGMSRYFPHGTSHWLGIETHDVMSAARDLRFEPGMVLTVEPGLYVFEESIGIRIEDDVVVTADGCRVLTGGLPKTVAEVEAACAAAPGVGARPVAEPPVAPGAREAPSPGGDEAKRRRLFRKRDEGQAKIYAPGASHRDP